MSKTTGLASRIRVLMTTCVVAAAVAGLITVSRAADKPGLAGKWSFNADQSDDANSQIQKAEQNSSSSGNYPGGGSTAGGGYPGGGYPGGGYPGGGYPGGRGGIGMGGIGGGGMGRGGRGQRSAGQGPSSEDLEKLARDPKTLTISQDDQKLSIVDDNGDVNTLYPDGKKHKQQDANGDTVEYKTHWDDQRLVAESKLKHSGKLTSTYELSPDGKQLFLTTRLDNSALAAPLIIRRVYDKAAVSAQ
jgi:hypothetical protein